MLKNMSQYEIPAWGTLDEPEYVPDRDLRAASRDPQRYRRQKEKYYDYRASNPQMVGQLYYTLTMAKNVEEDFDTRKRQRGRKQRKRSISVSQKEDRVAFNKSSYRHWGCFRIEVPELITIAAASADTMHRLSEIPAPELDSLVTSEPLDQALRQYREYTARGKEWNPEHYWTSRKYADNYLCLKVQRWTKRDNYRNRIEFDRYAYIRQCHYSRKLEDWQKRWQRATLKSMQRDTKSKILSFELANGIQSNREKFLELASHCTFPYCDQSNHTDPEFDPRGMEEYLWKWNDQCLCDWQEDCTCESVECEEDGVVSKDRYPFADPCSPASSTADWVWYAISDSESEFDVLSNLGDRFSDEDWEEIMSTPDS